MDITIPASVTASLGIDKPSTPVANPKPMAESIAEADKADAKPEPKEPEAKPELTAAQKRILKIKADGEEFDFDASDDEAVRQAVAKARGADKKFQTAAEMRKAAEKATSEAHAFLERLKSDPIGVLTDPRVGVDFKEVAEKFIWEQLQEQKLTPEQKRQRDIERELAKYKEQENQQKQTAEQQEFAKLQEHYEQNYQKTILDALDLGGIPKSTSAVRRMALYMSQAIEHGIDLEPKDLVERVKADLQAEHKELFEQADGDTLRKLLGENLTKKLRESDLKRLRTTQPQEHQRPARAERERPREQPKRKLSGDEWREQLARNLLGK